MIKSTLENDRIVVFLPKIYKRRLEKILAEENLRNVDNEGMKLTVASVTRDLLIGAYKLDKEDKM